MVSPVDSHGPARAGDNPESDTTAANPDRAAVDKLVHVAPEHDQACSGVGMTLSEVDWHGVGICSGCGHFAAVVRLPSNWMPDHPLLHGGRRGRDRMASDPR